MSFVRKGAPIPLFCGGSNQPDTALRPGNSFLSIRFSHACTAGDRFAVEESTAEETTHP
jgi:hypothetical protein